MKTKRIPFKTGGLFPLIIAAILAFALMGCQEEDPFYPEKSPELEPEYDGNIMVQTFTVYPEGTEVNAFGGSVWLKFPEGTVSEPTDFNIATHPIHHLDIQDFNIYNRGISLQGEVPNQKIVNVSIRLKYDLIPDSWKKNAPGPEAEKNMTIYHVSPFICAYQRITSIGDCNVDCSCKMIKGCIDGCGLYVVGEN